MSGRKRKKRDSVRQPVWWEAPWLAGVVLLVLAAYLILSLGGPTVPWWQWLAGDRLPSPITGDNPGGPVGAVLAFALQVIWGAAWAWLVPALLIVIGIEALTARGRWSRAILLRAAPLWLVTAAWIGQEGWPWADGVSQRWAGLAGVYVARGFHALFGLWGGRLLLGLAVIVTVALALRPWLGRPVGAAGRWLAQTAVWLARTAIWVARRLGGGLGAGWRRLRRFAVRGRETPAAVVQPAPGDQRQAGLPGAGPAVAPGAAAEPSPRERRVHWPDENETGTPPIPGALIGAMEDEAAAFAPPPAPSGPVELPALELLTEPLNDTPELSPRELDANADKLEETLRSFGVEGEVKDVRPGPVVTTYEYQPAAGIRVNQIVQRANDLALAMRARSLRLEAPIPGKAAVGIEIPNSNAQLVSLREILQLEAGRPRRPLTVTLGKDVIGQPVSIDLATQPHLLVAGATGSGKSVCLNAMITNLLLYNDPARVRLLLIDPKMLEMSVYNGIPHLLLPVVTDPREALRAMNWMCAQMDLRYRQLARHAVRNIEQYNDKVTRGEVLDGEGQPVTELMPYYLTIVDELADLMVQLGQDFEIPVTRLAQKARAVGLHLVLATQRPSVDVLTGVIKANIPCRIAFRVIQRNDSRTILDQNGAEQLLGHGDMLYLMPGRAAPIRVHGAFVDVPDCEAVVAHWRAYAGVAEEISLTAGGSGGTGMHTGEDELFDDAVRVIVTHQSGSTSLLQRRLRIGYTRAGRLMDMMEEAGIVGPFTGSKARDVLVKPADLPDLFGDEAAE